MRDVITGEAVVLDLPLAQLASRSVAFALDVVVLVVGFAVLLLVETLSGVLDADGAIGAAVVIGSGVLLFVGVPVTVETLSRGRSLGKLVMGLRVVRDDGGPIRFRHALARGLAGLFVDFGVFSFFTGAVALISSLVSPRGKRIGDLLAGTVVVRERAPAPVHGGIVMPPPLAAWARSLALSQLPDGLALTARQFLLRATGLDQQVRASMAASFATELAAVVSPAPPQGTPAEAYIAAVLAERSRRESERLAAAAPQPNTPPAPTPEPPAPEPGSGFALPR